MAAYVKTEKSCYEQMIASWQEFCDLQAEIAARRYTRACFQYWINHQHELDLHLACKKDNGCGAGGESGYVNTFLEMFIESFRKKFAYEFELHVQKTKQISEEDFCSVVRIPVNSESMSTSMALSSITIASSSDDRSKIGNKKSLWSFLRKLDWNVFRNRSSAKNIFKMKNLSANCNKKGYAKIITPSDLESANSDNWQDCCLVLTKGDDGYVVEFYVPENSKKPYYKIMCLLINELRRTAPLETPNHENTFYVKTDEDFEIFVDVFTSDELHSWLATIKFCQKPSINGFEEQTSPLQNWIQMCNNYPWFHGPLSREIASRYVLNHTKDEYGQFLVRLSNTHKDNLVLTVNCYKKVYHICMRFVLTGYFEIKGKWFSSIFDLMDHYRRLPLPIKDTQLPLKLLEYVVRKDIDLGGLNICADTVSVRTGAILLKFIKNIKHEYFS